MRSPDKEQRMWTRTSNFMYEVARLSEKASKPSTSNGIEIIDRLTMEKSEMTSRFIYDMQKIFAMKDDEK